MASYDLVWAVLIFLLSVVATGLVRTYALKSELLDVPGHRSSHATATPRGGGLGFVTVFLVSIVVLFLVDRVDAVTFLALIIGGTMISGVGFLDDHGHVPALRRLIVQFVAAVIAVYFLGGLPPLPVGDGIVDLGILGDVLALVACVWLVNLYNFMDGIDGIASVQTLSVVVGAAILSHGGSPDISAVLVYFGASVAGFLVWNWPPARLFMGDVGSGFLGFVLAVFAIVSSSQGLLSIWVWIILSAVFVVDATFTLVTRIIRGEKWHSPHNSHAYQIAARRFGGHRPVTIAVFLVNALWLFPLAWQAKTSPGSGWWLTCIAVAPLIIVARVVGAGRAESDNSS